VSDILDIVVPVYRGEAETRACLESVFASANRRPVEIVVIDDRSPEPAISAWLKDLARLGRITLIEHEENRGFVQSVNEGMALHRDRDVVLLNSDTEVANDWLDRLREAAQSAADIGTATPFSNNATICSYPFEGWDGGVPGSLGLAGLDRVTAEANRGQRASIPTAVGFCMYIRRACLDKVGAFDAERFGRGYGEENDFCLRASAAGWRHVLAADVFVYHEGAVSFSEGRAAFGKSNRIHRTRVTGDVRRELIGRGFWIFLAICGNHVFSFIAQRALDVCQQPRFIQLAIVW